MKRYMAFVGSNYYPAGGMNDFIGSYETKELAIGAIEKDVIKNNIYDTIEEQWEFKWGHVFDTETMLEVWSK